MTAARPPVQSAQLRLKQQQQFQLMMLEGIANGSATTDEGIETLIK